MQRDTIIVMKYVFLISALISVYLLSLNILPGLPHSQQASGNSDWDHLVQRSA